MQKYKKNTSFSTFYRKKRNVTAESEIIYRHIDGYLTDTSLTAQDQQYACRIEEQSKSATQ
jgi:hypothetical protein